jgi:hypothetical protein
MLTRDTIVQKLNFNGPDWVLLETWLQQERNTKIGLLLSAATEKDADKFRGAIQYIDSLLAFKRAATMAANESR